MISFLFVPPPFFLFCFLKKEEKRKRDNESDSLLVRVRSTFPPLYRRSPAETTESYIIENKRHGWQRWEKRRVDDAACVIESSC